MDDNRGFGEHICHLAALFALHWRSCALIPAKKPEALQQMLPARFLFQLIALDMKWSDERGDGTSLPASCTSISSEHVPLTVLRVSNVRGEFEIVLKKVTCTIMRAEMAKNLTFFFQPDLNISLLLKQNKQEIFPSSPISFCYTIYYTLRSHSIVFVPHFHPFFFPFLSNRAFCTLPSPLSARWNAELFSWNCRQFSAPSSHFNATVTPSFPLLCAFQNFPLVAYPLLPFSDISLQFK